MRLYRRNTGWSRTVAVTLLAFVLVVICVVSLINRAEDSVQAKQLLILENALRSATVTCYALEGRYPATLEDLIHRYGLVIDSDKYIVHYDAFARNIMPGIEVYTIGGAESDAM